jgi:hypothetical protein
MASELRQEGLVNASIEQGVENEKCVVTQYRTTTEQRIKFAEHLTTCSRDKIPIEWVIDIADETNGWFFGTAYHFDETTEMLHVMVPDKQNPSFDGNVVLDHRTVHLIECVDGKTEALFNKIVRDSIMKIKWEVEWFEEDPSAPENSAADATPSGKWIMSSARYYIRMANQLLVEDENFGDDSRGFVMLTADLNVRLRNCHKGRGKEDFERLIMEGITLYSQEAYDSIQDTRSPATKAKRAEGNFTRGDYYDNGSSTTRKLADMTRSLADSTNDLVEERDKTFAEQVEIANMFNRFTLEGDLMAGLELQDAMSAVIDKHAAREKGGESADAYDYAADECLKLASKVEKSVIKFLKNSNSGNEDAEAEIDHLRKQLKKMKREIEDRELEVDELRAQMGK